MESHVCTLVSCVTEPSRSVAARCCKHSLPGSSFLGNIFWHTGSDAFSVSSRLFGAKQEKLPLGKSQKNTLQEASSSSLNNKGAGGKDKTHNDDRRESALTQSRSSRDRLHPLNHI